MIEPGPIRQVDRFLETEIEARALEITQMRVVSRERGDGKPDPASSILKICGSELQQATSALLMDVIGPASAIAHRDSGDEEYDWARAGAATYFNLRKLSIYGGANEIQRTIVAKSILGL